MRNKDNLINKLSMSYDKNYSLSKMKELVRYGSHLVI
jgi:hypothetical protein